MLGTPLLILAVAVVAGTLLYIGSNMLLEGSYKRGQYDGITNMTRDMTIAIDLALSVKEGGEADRLMLVGFLKTCEPVAREAIVKVINKSVMLGVSWN